MGQKSNLPTVQQENNELIAMPMSVFGSMEAFAAAQRMANLLAASSIVPMVYRGEKGFPNCVVALEMANRMQASPLMVMQNLYIVNGNPSFSSKFLISCLNTCGRFTALRYEFRGKENTDEWGCRAYAVEKSTGETLYSAWVTIGMAKAEGWYGKAGSKWKTMPQLMLQYRSAAFFQRLYAPEISMGMKTSEEEAEIVDFEEVKQEINPEVKVSEKEGNRAADILAKALDGNNQKQAAPENSESEPAPEPEHATQSAPEGDQSNEGRIL